MPKTKSGNDKEKFYSFGVGCRIKIPHDNFQKDFLDSSELLPLLPAFLHIFMVNIPPD